MAVGHVDVVPVQPFHLANEAVEVDQNGMAVVDDPTGTSRAVEGDIACASIEVEAVPIGKKSVERIVFNPPPPQEQPESLSTECRDVVEQIEQQHPAIIPEENSVVEPVDDSLMGSLIESFMGTCGDADDCKCSPMKSALKKEHAGPAVDRTVSFSNLEIREFPMTLGNHPSSKHGPPMSLDWEANPESKVVDLDVYERNRNPRRGRKNLRISIKEREKILVKEQGFSYTEIRDAWAAAIEVRKQRLDTLRRSPQAEMMDEAWESANRKFWRLFGCQTV